MTKEEDPLKVILSELGAVPPAGYGSKQAGSEIVLELKDRFAKVGGKSFVQSQILIPI